MDIKEIETLKAEIERFKTESLKTHIVKVWAESYTNSDPFGYAILKRENNKVWWMKTQAHQLWEMWLAAKATPEGFVLVRKELPEKVDFKLTDYFSDISEGENYDTFVKLTEIDNKAIYKAMIEAQEQSHD